MKRIIAMVVCMSILMSITVMAGENFSDVADGSWYEEHVVDLVDKGIITGYPDGNFKPTVNITADQFIKTMIIALGYDVELGADYWASLYIEKARELKLIDSYDFQTRVSSSAAITRGQMSKICERTITILDGEQTYTKIAKIKEAITDISNVEASGLSDYIYHMYELGVIKGYPDKTFKASSPLSRAEAVTVIRRVINDGIRVPFVEEVGVVIMEQHEDASRIEFRVTLDIYKPLDLQYKQAEEYLRTKAEPSTVDVVMEYVKLKTIYDYELPIKYFKWKNSEIQVQSYWGESNIWISGL